MPKFRKVLFWGVLLVIGYVVAAEEGWIPELPFDKSPSTLESAPVKIPDAKPFNILQSTLYVDSIPQGATIQLSDAKEAKYTPYLYDDLDHAITHQLTIAMEGYRAYQEIFHLRKGEKKVVVVKLEKN